MKRLLLLSMVAWAGSALADASPAWIEISPQPLVPTVSVEGVRSGTFDFLWCCQIISNTLDIFKTTPPTGMLLFVR